MTSRAALLSHRFQVLHREPRVSYTSVVNDAPRSMPDADMRRREGYVVDVVGRETAGRLSRSPANDSMASAAHGVATSALPPGSAAATLQAV